MICLSKKYEFSKLILESYFRRDLTVMPIFFKPSASDLSLSADSIGNHWPQEPVVRPDGFPLYHWIQTERGEGLLTLGGQQIPLKAGDGILIAPHVPHEYRENGGNGLWYTSFLTFDGKLSEDLYKICAVSPYLFVPAADGAWFQEWIDRVIVSHFQNNEMDDSALSVQCFEFLTRLSQLSTGLSQTEHPLYLQYVRPAMQKIESHLSDPLDVDDLAEQLHITPQYLTRLFQRFVGSSVRSYITVLRISRAKELLISRPYTTLDGIADLCGYRDVSYFISVFRQQTGTTPKQFRKLYGV